MDLSRFDAAPLIVFTLTKETDYGTETLHQAEDDLRADETNSILYEHRSKRHLADLELFKQFKQKPETPSWLPELQEFY